MMKFLICCFLFIGVVALAEERVKRQASYTFPGPRSDRSYRQSLSASPVYVEEHDGEAYPASRRQYQPQPQPQPQPQYAAAQPRAPAQPVAAPAPPPVYEPAPAPRQAAPAPRAQSSPSSSARRRASSSSASNRANKYGSAPQQSLNGHDEEEEEAGPDPLTLLLEDSQFTCGGKQDGYYADDSVNCQVFHYCVGGAKHSWMCPENTVFHQVHLNCVPDAQDICSQSQKFHFVNEYLYKPVDYEGPNKTARYSQRYYPENYSVGDAIVAPQEANRPAFQQPPQYHSPPSAPRQQPRQVAPPPPQPTYRAPQPQPAPQPRPQSRPSRPLESYPVEDSREYRPQAPPQAAPQTYRAAQPQPQQPQGPPPQAYRAAAAAAQQARPSPHSAYTSSEEAHYQPQPPPQSRRPAAPAPQRPTAAYAPPRQQYRQQASSRSGTGYQPYAPSQAAGVEYDEDY